MTRYERDPITRWTGRIRALLAKAADPTVTDQERQLFQARAAELMTRFGIEQTQLHAGDRGHGPEQAEIWAYAVAGLAGLGEARAQAAARIVQAMGCKAVWHSRPAATNSPVTLMVTGVVADITALKTLLPLVLEQAELAAVAAATGGRRDRSYLASFLTGYGARVAERISHRRGAYAAEGTGAELVLASRERIVDQLYQQTFGHLAVHQSASRERADGLSAGRAAAGHADLGDARLGETTRRALPGSHDGQRHAG